MKISKLINLSIISYLWFQNVKEETVIIFWKPLVFRVLKLIEIFIEFNLPYSLDWLIWKNCILNKSYHSNFQFYHQQKKSQNNDWITNWKLLFFGGFYTTLKFLINEFENFLRIYLIFQILQFHYSSIHKHFWFVWKSFMGENFKINQRCQDVKMSKGEEVKG